ncbi:MAG: hypothetical protein ABEJ59_02665 [Halanaeroarchaeum sp.]
MRSALPALFAVLLVTTAGCVGADQPRQPPNDDRATAAVDRARTALQNLSTYRFRIDGSVSAAGDGQRVHVEVQGHGVVEAKARQMLGRTSARGTSRRYWVVGDRIDTARSTLGWARSNRSTGGPWMAVTPVASQLAVLSHTPVTGAGTTSTTGTTRASSWPIPRQTPSRPSGTTDRIPHRA